MKVLVLVDPRAAGLRRDGWALEGQNAEVGELRWRRGYRVQCIWRAQLTQVNALRGDGYR